MFLYENKSDTFLSDNYMWDCLIYEEIGHNSNVIHVYII